MTLIDNTTPAVSPVASPAVSPVASPAVLVVNKRCPPSCPRSSQLPTASPAVVDHRSQLPAASPAVLEQAAAAEADVHSTCDECNTWFVLQETGLTAEDADKLDSFECSQCRVAGSVCLSKTFKSAQLLCTVIQLIDDTLLLHWHPQIAATLGLSTPHYVQLCHNLGYDTSTQRVASGSIRLRKQTNLARFPDQFVASGPDKTVVLEDGRNSIVTAPW